MMRFSRTSSWRDRGRRRYVPARRVTFRRALALRQVLPAVEPREWTHPVRRPPAEEDEGPVVAQVSWPDTSSTAARIVGIYEDQVMVLWEWRESLNYPDW